MSAAELWNILYKSPHCDNFTKKQVVLLNGILVFVVSNSLVLNQESYRIDIILKLQKKIKGNSKIEGGDKASSLQLIP